jgi:uncharacterized protein involved in response to NO
MSQPLSPAPATRPAGTPAIIFSYGFRPFFLVAAIFSPLAILLWLGVFSGEVSSVSAYPPNLWHGHEMLFGYAGAVMAGFFLTAVPNWTGTPPLRGRPLAILAALWLAARGAVWLTPIVPPLAAAALDLSFFVALGLMLVPALSKGSRKNLVFLAVLTLLVLANLLFHLEALGLRQTASLGLNAGVDLFAVLITVIGGRVTPAFTGNALRAQAEAQHRPPPEIKSYLWLNEAAILSVAIFAVCELAAPGRAWLGWIALVASSINAARMAGWRTGATLNQPLLWVLHLGYGWLVLGLAVKGIAALTGILPASVALHGITMGAIGTMTLAMMSRATLGHTGRALAAGPALAAAYVLISLAAAVRLLMPILLPDQYPASVAVAGMLWIAAFSIFVVKFVPILAKSRADGRPG